MKTCAPCKQMKIFAISNAKKNVLVIFSSPLWLRDLTRRLSTTASNLIAQCTCEYKFCMNKEKKKVLIIKWLSSFTRPPNRKLSSFLIHWVTAERIKEFCESCIKEKLTQQPFQSFQDKEPTNHWTYSTRTYAAPYRLKHQEEGFS